MMARSLEEVTDRLEHEVSKYLDIKQIFQKLKTQGTLLNIYELFFTIFQSEHEFTLKRLKTIEQQQKDKGDANFSFEEHYRTNTQIFKMNMQLLMQLVVEDLWKYFTKLCVEGFNQNQLKIQPSSHQSSLTEIQPVSHAQNSLLSRQNQQSTKNLLSSKFNSQKNLQEESSGERTYKLQQPQQYHQIQEQDSSQNVIQMNIDTLSKNLKHILAEHPNLETAKLQTPPQPPPKSAEKLHPKLEHLLPLNLFPASLVQTQIEYERGLPPELANLIDETYKTQSSNKKSSFPLQITPQAGKGQRLTSPPPSSQHSRGSSYSAAQTSFLQPVASLQHLHNHHSNPLRSTHNRALENLDSGPLQPLRGPKFTQSKRKLTEPLNSPESPGPGHYDPSPPDTTFMQKIYPSSGKSSVSSAQHSRAVSFTRSPKNAAYKINRVTTNEQLYYPIL